MLRKGSSVRVRQRALISEESPVLRGFPGKGGLARSAATGSMETFWKPRLKRLRSRKPSAAAYTSTAAQGFRAGLASVVARRADVDESAEGVPVKVVLDCEWAALIPRCIHSRFGDGLGCPSSNREYRDSDPVHRSGWTSRCGVKVSPAQLDEKLYACWGVRLGLDGARY
jgi:hypothetical protein